MDWQQSWRGGPIKHTHPSLKKANFVLVNIKGGKQDQMSSNVREPDPDPPKKSIISFLVLINFYFKISTHWTGTKSMLKNFSNKIKKTWKVHIPVRGLTDSMYPKSAKSRREEQAKASSGNSIESSARYQSTGFRKQSHGHWPAKVENLIAFDRDNEI